MTQTDHYKGLARKWRPQGFSDLVGQAHIATILTRAIETHRMSHAYLFTGTRGIGKTSAARILAKALRCLNVKNFVESCNKCADCVEIAEGRSMDVLEIDGASNNGVDAIREIRENAKFLPSSGTRKIYIIDEVHMLTTAAFNALLKTLEEPPAHVLFIFATTDPQKIPATILSRCQRFDFKRVNLKDLEGRLNTICETEGVKIQPDAVHLLAREAEGSMRDAVSLLDQVMSSGASPISGKAVTESLGLVDNQVVLECVTAILKREPLQAIDAAGKVYIHGFDLKQFAREVLRTIRLILISKLLSQSNTEVGRYLDVSDIELSDVKGLIAERSLEDLDMLFRMLNYGLEDIARSPIPKIVLDVLLIKMASASDLVRVEDLTAEMMEAASPQSFAPAPTVAAPQMPASAPVPPAPRREALRDPEPSRPPEPPKVYQPPVAAAPAVAKLPELSEQQWQKCVVFIRSQKPVIGSILEGMALESIRAEGALIFITLTFKKDHAYQRDQIQSKAYAEAIGQLLKSFWGKMTKLELKEVAAGKTIESLDDQRRKIVLESDALKATQQLLGARVEKLEIRERSPQ